MLYAVASFFMETDCVVCRRDCVVRSASGQYAVISCGMETGRGGVCRCVIRLGTGHVIHSC